MNKSIRIGIAIVVIILLLFLTGCSNKTENKENILNNNSENNTDILKEEKQEKSIKNGIYNMVLTDEDISFVEGDIYLEIVDDKITMYNNFAQIVQEGIFEINNNKLTGTYTKIKYLDHQNGGKETEKSINDELDFSILEDGTLKDNLGFGKSIGKNLMEERTYKIEREYKENASWKDIYLDFVLYDLPESINAEDNDNYQTPFIGLIDLNFDNTPELLYYDGEDFAGYGGKTTSLYTIENGKVVYKDEIIVTENEKFLKVNNQYVIYYSDVYYEPTGEFIDKDIIDGLKIIRISRVSDDYYYNNEKISSDEFNEYLNKYCGDINAENSIEETLQSKRIMNSYTKEEKTNIFNELANKFND